MPSSVPAHQPVTVLVMTKNEEEMLPHCLACLSWADEVLVVDSYSTDRTVEIAGNMGARVVQHPFAGFADQTNWGIQEATHDWTLQVDADELITPELRDSILKTLTNPQHELYDLRRDGIVFGQRLRSRAWSKEYLPRLFRRGAVHFTGVVHPLPHYGDRQVGRLDGIMLHYTYRSVDKYFEKFQYYSTLWAEKAYEQGRRTSIAKAAAAGGWRLFHDYLIRGGILDGRLGLVLSVLAGMHTYIRHTKLWGIQNRDRFSRLRPEDLPGERQHGT